MKKPQSTRPKKLPKDYPRYDERDIKVIARYLVSFGMAARAMRQRSKEQMQNTGYEAMMVRQYEYWDASIGVVRDMITRLTHRQRHLVEVTDYQIGEVLQAWHPELMPLFAPEEYTQSLVSTTTQAAEKEDMLPPGPLLTGSGGGSKPKRSKR